MIFDKKDTKLVIALLTLVNLPHYSPCFNFHLSICNIPEIFCFLPNIQCCLYLVQKDSDVPSWLTYLPTMSLLSPTMLYLPTYLPKIGTSLMDVPKGVLKLTDL